MPIRTGRKLTPAEAKAAGEAMEESFIQSLVDGFKRNPYLLQPHKDMLAAMRRDGFNPPDLERHDEAIRRYEAGL